MNQKIESPLKIKYILSDVMIRARLIDRAEEVDALLEESTGKIIRAVHAREELLTAQQVAARWPFLGGQKLQNFRYLHQGPKYLKFGKDRNSRVYYKVADIEAWIAEHYQDAPYVAGLTLPKGDPGP